MRIDAGTTLGVLAHVTGLVFVQVSSPFVTLLSLVVEVSLLYKGEEMPSSGKDIVCCVNSTYKLVTTGTSNYTLST